MPSLEPPNDDSIRTLYVGGLDIRIGEQDIRDKFSAHGQIETVKMIPSRQCAFVMYTTREGAEKAAEELSNMLIIKGQKLKLMWGRPQTLKPESVVFDEAREQAFGKVRSYNTILKLQRTAPYYTRIQAHVCSFYSMGEMPVTTELSLIKDRYYGVNESAAMKLLNKAGEMPSLEPPEDESIRTLYVGGFDKRINESDLRDSFNVHGEIETIKMVPSRACAFVTYMTRESAEKAAEEFSNKLVIKGLRLKLMWGRPQAPKLESIVSDEAKQQVANLSKLLKNHVLQSPGIQDQHPAAPQQGRAYYPLQDSQRTGAGIPSHEGTSTGSNENKSGSQNQQGPINPAYLGMPPPYYPNDPPQAPSGHQAGTP